MKSAPPLPIDVRVMNATTWLMLGAFGVMALSVVGWWGVRHPLFALSGITVQGDVGHTSAATLRANVAPRVQGTFFTVNLGVARQAFREVPWVRDAVVRREFPDRLRVILQEHRPVAFWGADGETLLVNSFGEVFEANPGDLDQDDLPRLIGPREQSALVLATYRALAPMFQTLELQVEQLTLTARGSWQARLDTGASVELGRGTTEEIGARAQRFVQTLTQATSRYGRRPEALVAADLRHADGYAIRLRGVSTLGIDTQKK